MHTRTAVGCLAVTAILLEIGVPDASSDNYLNNGDFETGDLTGWTVFYTPEGTTGAGLPDIVMFDTDGDATPSQSARFNAGHISNAGAGAGGGIYQVVNLANSGSYTLSACAAMLVNGGSGDNSQGGVVELMFDGAVLDAHDFGYASAGVPEYTLLGGLAEVLAGPHEVRIRISRGWISAPPGTPYQYIDEVNLVPEPATVSLLVLGGLAMLRRRVTR
jgi:hypothetical protein